MVRLGGADGPPGRRGRSAGQVSFCPETMLPLVVFARLNRIDSPCLAVMRALVSLSHRSINVESELGMYI